MSTQNWAPGDDHDTVLGLLDGPDALTMDELAVRTGLGLGRLNGVLCDLNLAGRIVPQKVRARGKAVTKYTLKERQPWTTT